MFPIFRRIPLLAASLAGVAMISTTAWQGYLFWQDIRQPVRPAGTAALAAPQQHNRPVPQPDWQRVPLFGQQTADTQNTVASTENLPATNLRLYLRGVLAADGDSPGSALVEDDKGRTEVYLIGDELPGNARLHAVFPSRIVLERSGKLENLYFPDPEAAGAASATRVVPAGPAQQPEVTTSPAPAATVTAPAPAPDREQSRREEIRRRLELLRQRLRNQN